MPKSSGNNRSKKVAASAASSSRGRLRSRSPVADETRNQGATNQNSSSSTNSDSNGPGAPPNNLISTQSQTSPHPLSFLNGTWKSSVSPVITVKDGTVTFDGEIASVYEIKLISDRASASSIMIDHNSVCAIEVNGWKANGVKSLSEDIIWYNDEEDESPLIWSRIYEQPKSSAELTETLDKIMERTLRAQQRLYEVARSELKNATDNILANTGDALPQCKVCMNHPIGIALLGCGHTLCIDCSEQQCQPGKPCFVCKIPYAGKQRIYF